MNLFKHPVTKTVLVVLGVLLVLPIVRPWLSKLPVLNRL